MKERSYWERRDAVLQSVYYAALVIAMIGLVAMAFVEKMFYFDFFSQKMDMAILCASVLQLPILYALAVGTKSKMRVEIFFSISWCATYIIISLPIVFLLGGVKNIVKHIEAYGAQCARNEMRRFKARQKMTP